MKSMATRLTSTRAAAAFDKPLAFAERLLDDQFLGGTEVRCADQLFAAYLAFDLTIKCHKCSRPRDGSGQERGAVLRTHRATIASACFFAAATSLLDVLCLQLLQLEAERAAPRERQLVVDLEVVVVLRRGPPKQLSVVEKMAAEVKGRVLETSEQRRTRLAVALWCREHCALGVPADVQRMVAWWSPFLATKARRTRR